MAMATLNVSDEFDGWLRKKLLELNTDDEIFSPYIMGILGSDDSDEEKLEALDSILSGIIEEDIQSICSEILGKWSSALQDSSKREESVEKLDLNEKLAKLIENTHIASQPTTAASSTSAEQQKLKQAILAQYAQVSDGEVEEEEDETPMEKNMNAAAVINAEKAKREKEKEESQKKKDKDKEDRAKQKVKDEERKEKEKKRTQKGERRR